MYLLLTFDVRGFLRDSGGIKGMGREKGVSYSSN